MARKNDTRIIPTQFQGCRGWSHLHWEFTTVTRQGGHYVQGMVCTNCATEKFVHVDARTGLRIGHPRYIHPDDYLVTGGALSVEERAVCRLAELESHLGERRARKARRLRTVGE